MKENMIKEIIARIKEDEVFEIYNKLYKQCNNLTCVKIKNLKNEAFSFKNIANKKGIYFVLYLANRKPNFINPGICGSYKKKNPNLPITILNNNWVYNTTLIYIGQAGGKIGNRVPKSTLRSRIKQFIKCSINKTCSHCGGKNIWQINNSEDLIICWFDTTFCNNKKDPRQIERALLYSFKKKYHKLPFANNRI